MSKKHVGQLPSIFQTLPNNKFFDATVDQLFSKKDSKKYDGYIGRRVPGAFNPISDYYIPEINRDRTWYQLEPTVISTDSETLETTNINFYTDLINRIRTNGGLVGNHDRLFSDNIYSFSPPIDVDKFVNYQNYLWFPKKLSPIEVVGVDDYYVENEILGKVDVTISMNSNDDTLHLYSGVRVMFVDSTKYNIPLTVEDSGKGIRLVPDYTEVLAAVVFTPLPWDGDGSVSGLALDNSRWDTMGWDSTETSSIGQDYITIQRGSLDSNLWSRSNKWFHINAVDETIKFTGQSLPRTAVRANRPIIEFVYNIELYNFGTHFFSEIDQITGNFSSNPITATFSDINGKTLSQIKQVSGFEESIADDVYIFSNDLTQLGDGTYSDYAWKLISLSGLMYLVPNKYTPVSNVLSYPNSFGVTGTAKALPNPVDLAEISYCASINATITSTFPIIVDSVNVGTSFTALANVPMQCSFSAAAWHITTESKLDGKILTNNNVLVTKGIPRADGGNLGYFFRKTLTGWEQCDNQKTKQNLPPLFSLFDLDRVPLDNTAKYEMSSFKGNKIFSYAVDTSPTAIDDRVLGFPLRYKSSIQGSDIIFVNDIVEDRVTWLNGQSLETIPGYYMYRIVSESDAISDIGDWRFYTIWQESTTVTKQCVVDKFSGTAGVSTYPISVRPYAIDSSDAMLVGNKVRSENITLNERPYVYLLDTVNENDDIEIKTYTHDNLPANTPGFFEIPVQLEANPLNDEVAELTYGEITPHFLSIISNQSVAENDPRNKDNNYFNSQKDITLGDRIVQNKASLVKSMFATSSDDLSIFESVRLANNNYVSFKSHFAAYAARHAIDLDYSETVLRKAVSDIVAVVNRSKNFSDAFRYSDMVKTGSPETSVVYPISLENSVIPLGIAAETETYILRTAAVPYLKHSQTKVTLLSGNTVIPDSDYTIRSVSAGYAIQLVTSTYDGTSLSAIATVGKVSLSTISYDLSVHSNGLYVYDVVVSSGKYKYQRMMTAGSEYTLDSMSNMIYFNYGSVGSTVLIQTYRNYAPSYIPPTPAKLGMSDRFLPELKVDNTGVSPRVIIKGHDGSITKAYSQYQKLGNEYVLDTNGIPIPEGMNTTDVFSEPIDILLRYFDQRDLLILELEKMIFNGLSDVSADYIPVFNRDSVLPSAFRDTRYNNNEISFVITPYVSRWSAQYKLDYRQHDGFDPANWKTFNYRQNSQLVWNNDSRDWVPTVDRMMPGHWRGIFLHYYDCITPEITPWELLGFSIKPEWWSVTNDSGDQFTGYGTDYSSNNTAMWADIEQGIIRRGTRAGQDKVYVRTGLCGDSAVLNLPVWADDSQINLRSPYTGVIGNNNIIPVDSSGTVRTVSAIFNTVHHTDDPWVIGDMSPVEYTWYTSSEHAYNEVETLFMLRPAAYGEFNWDTQGVRNLRGNMINSYTGTRKYPEDYLVHGEMSASGVATYREGYQQFISDYLAFNNRSVDKLLGDRFRNLDVKLGHKVGGFTNSANMRLYLESSTTVASTGDLLIPNTNYSIYLYKGAPVYDYTYSGVVVRKEQNGYSVFGYDVNRPIFMVHPAKTNSIMSRVIEGGTYSQFVDFQFNVSYDKGTIVKYNGSYYIALVKITNASTFSGAEWERLPSLPYVGGQSAIYYEERDLGITIPYSYGHKFKTVQELYDFIIGYGSWLENEGWQFDELDGDAMPKNWKSSASALLFWLSSDKSAGETLLISPSAESATLSTKHGYIDKVEKTLNGFYSIVDKNGLMIDPYATVIDRDDRRLTATTVDTNKGIYGMRATASETEHIIIVDQVSDFNDIIYSPLLRSRQGRLRIVFYRTSNWFGKLNAPGYLVNGNQLIPSVDNLAESFRYFYSDYKDIDSSDVTAAARKLIGYENKDFLDRLDVTDDVQFNFYQGFVREKGSVNSITKILRSKKITDKNDINWYEEWAIKLGEYGGVAESNEVEFKSKFTDVLAEPQGYRLNYKVKDTMYVESIEFYNLEETYLSVPNVIIDPSPTGDNAAASVVLDSFGKILSILVTHRGSGYTSSPTVKLSGDFVITPDTNYDVDGNPITRDVVYAVVKMTTVKDTSIDAFIEIDVNDVDVCSYIRNADLNSTVSMSGTIAEYIPNSGYVSSDEVNYSVFNNLSMLDRTQISPTDRIHIAKTTQNTWAVAKLVTSNIVISEVDGELILNVPSFTGTTAKLNATYVNCSFNYDLVPFRMQVRINDLTYLVKLENSVHVLYDISTDEKVSDITLAGLPVYMYVNCRYRNDAARSAAISANLITSTELAYVDRSSGGAWRVYRNNSVYRVQGKLIDTSLFETLTLKVSDDSQKELPVCDYLKGILPGPFAKNLTYVSDSDPATYTNSESPFDDGVAFARAAVGQTWLDSTTFSVIYYELPRASTQSVASTLEYRRKNWCKLFPGSTAVVYEWVESELPPRQYSGSGEPRSIEEYTEVKTYDRSLQGYVSTYYFWVKNSESVPTTPNRTISVKQMSNMLVNPAAYRYAYYSPIYFDSNNLSMVVSNSDEVIAKSDVSLVLRYNTSKYTPPEHADWKLLSASRFSEFPEFLWDNLVESMIGFTLPINLEYTGSKIQSGDDVILPVPNPSVSEYSKFGLQIRPRQSMFTDRFSARKVMIPAINELLSDIQIWKTVYSLWDQGIDTACTYYVDWFATGYNNDNTRTSLQVNDTDDLLSLNLTDGDLIKVYPFVPNAQSRYEVYLYELGNFVLVRREAGSIQIAEDSQDTIYNARWNESLRQVLYSIKENIFVSNERGKLQDTFFAALNYSFSEKKELDWAFKTSYMSVVQEGKKLDQPLYVSPDQLSEYIAYVESAKPYHTKVRDVYVSYAIEDLAPGNVFDNYIGSYDPSTDYTSANFELLRSSVIKVFFDDFSDIQQRIQSFAGWDASPWSTTNQAIILSRGRKYYTDSSIGWDSSVNIATMAVNSEESSTTIIDATLGYNNELVKTRSYDVLSILGEDQVNVSSGWDTSAWDTSGWDTSVLSTEIVKYLINSNYDCYPARSQSVYSLSESEKGIVLKSLSPEDYRLILATNATMPEAGKLCSSNEVVKYTELKLYTGSEIAGIYGDSLIDIDGETYSVYEMVLQRGIDSTLSGDIPENSNMWLAMTQILDFDAYGIPTKYNGDSILSFDSQVTTTPSGEIVPITNPWYVLETDGSLTASTVVAKRLLR